VLIRAGLDALASIIRAHGERARGLLKKESPGAAP
jgi:hypothetical protein